MNIIGSIPINAYKTYLANLTQLDSAAPVAVPLINTIPFTISYSRLGVGLYKMDFSQLLYEDKLSLSFGDGLIKISDFNGFSLLFSTYSIADGLVPALADGLLLSTSFQLIQYL